MRGAWWKSAGLALAKRRPLAELHLPRLFSCVCGMRNCPDLQSAATKRPALARKPPCLLRRDSAKDAKGRHDNHFAWIIRAPCVDSVSKRHAEELRQHGFSRPSLRVLSRDTHRSRRDALHAEPKSRRAWSRPAAWRQEHARASAVIGRASFLARPRHAKRRSRMRAPRPQVVAPPTFEKTAIAELIPEAPRRGRVGRPRESQMWSAVRRAEGPGRATRKMGVWSQPNPTSADLAEEIHCRCRCLAPPRAAGH